MSSGEFEIHCCPQSVQICRIATKLLNFVVIHVLGTKPSMIDRLVESPSVPSNATSVGNKCKVGFVYSFSHEKCSKVPQAFIPACTRYLSLPLTFEKHVSLIPLGDLASYLLQEEEGCLHSSNIPRIYAALDSVA